jgi:hypothetical protein
MSDSSGGAKPKSILDGVDGLIDVALSLGGTGYPPLYRRRYSCKKIGPLSHEQTLAVVESILARIRVNWDEAAKHSASKQNWRFKKQDAAPSPKNKSPEVLCERAIVSIAADTWDDAANWVNQVPVASGLAGPSRDKHRCIDLVHRRDEGEYDFIELKIDSDTPLYATVEILIYGLLYMFWRDDKRLAEVRSLPPIPLILQAKVIHLIVAAPVAFYKKHQRAPNAGQCDLVWLETGINAALTALRKKYELGFTMDFTFKNLEDPSFPNKSLYKTST